MALEQKDIQDWANRQNGESVSPPAAEGEEAGEPVDPATALEELNALVTDSLAKAQELADAYRDSAEDDLAAKADFIAGELEESMNALSELTGGESADEGIEEEEALPE